MALDWDPPALAAIEGGGVRPGVLLRVATDPVIRLWLGAVRDLSIPADAVEDDAAAVYQSMGLLSGIPTLNQLLNGQADRVEFTLSGVAITGEIAAIASTEAADIRGAQVNVGFFAFDSNWQRITPVLWPWDGTADSLTIDRTGDTASAMRSITLSVGSLMTGRRRPFISYFTDKDQKRRSPDDDFFSFIRQYSDKTTKVWPV